MVHKIRALTDYVSASLFHPKLFLFAARHIIQRTVRFLHGFIRAESSKLACYRLAIERNTCSRSDLLTLLGRRMGVLVLRDSAEDLVIGIRDIDFHKAILLLRAAYPNGHMILDGVPSSRNSTDLWKPQAATRVGFVLSDGDRVSLERYQRRGSRYWLSQNRNNRSARAIYENILDEPGVHPLSKILPALTLEQRVQSEPIDVVYTWVNHRDREWADIFSYHRNLLRLGKEDSSGMSDATSLSRFHSVDELRYSLRSIHSNSPWSRRIHILTNCAPPDWLNTDHEQINWIHHRQIIPPEYLPTFSSHVIESYLHHIPGLATRFVYMNDDVFLTSPKDKLFFFSESGNSRAFLEEDGVVSGPCRETDPDYLNASRNSANLLMHTLGFWPTRLHKHAPFSLNRDVLEEIENKWKPDFSRFRQNKFRSIDDLNLTSFLYHHYALATGRAEVASLNLSLVMPMDIRWQNRLRTALRGNVDVLCINEGGVLRPAPNWHSSISRHLRASFPQRAPWERNDGHT